MGGPFPPRVWLWLGKPGLVGVGGPDDLTLAVGGPKFCWGDLWGDRSASKRPEQKRGTGGKKRGTRRPAAWGDLFQFWGDPWSDLHGSLPAIQFRLILFNFSMNRTFPFKLKCWTNGFMVFNISVGGGTCQGANQHPLFFVLLLLTNGCAGNVGGPVGGPSPPLAGHVPIINSWLCCNETDTTIFRSCCCFIPVLNENVGHCPVLGTACSAPSLFCFVDSVYWLSLVLPFCSYCKRLQHVCGPNIYTAVQYSVSYVQVFRHNKQQYC